jgi:S-formylglutathione hydrolase FrmB
MKRVAVAGALLVAITACGGHSSPAPAPSSSSAAPTAVAPLTPPDGPGRVIDGSFASASLGVTKKYKAYLPAGYDTLTARRYPVIYMLHGLGGDETNWIEAGKLDAAADTLRLQAIVVMPDGDDGFYANSATPVDKEKCLGSQPPFSREQAPEDYCVATANYEDYITRDLVAHVDATYRTIPERHARGIGGLSMGGFGALHLAMRHKDLFAASASHSGVDALLYVGPHPYTTADKVVLLDDITSWGKGIGPIGDHIRAIFGTDGANWRTHDPASLAADLKPGELALYLDAGSEDYLLLDDGAQYLHDLLTKRGIEHDWYMGPGTHNFDFWRERIDDSLAFFTRSLAPAAP